MDKKINLCIFGVGGVGGYFGGKIIAALQKYEDNAINVSFVARGQHLEQIKKNGLVLNCADTTSVVKPTLATDNPNNLPDVDICLLCVKSYDLIDAVNSLKPKLNPNSLMLPLLNGVNIYEQIREVLNSGIVFRACLYVGTHIEKPGVVKQSGGGRLVIGPDPHFDQFYPHSLIDLLNKTEVDCKWQQNPDHEIWGKFMFIAPFALVCSLHNKTLGQVIKSVKLKREVAEIMAEILAIAGKKGIALNEDIIAKSIQKGSDFPFETKTSLHRDIESGKKNELDLFGGAIINMGQETGVPTTITKYFYEELKKKSIT